MNTQYTMTKQEILETISDLKFLLSMADSLTMAESLEDEIKKLEAQLG